MEIKPAGFALRLLASLNDSALFILLHGLFWSFIAQSPNLTRFTYNLVLYLITLFLPLSILYSLFYVSWLTSRFGGTLGKLITGLRVTGENGNLLSYTRNFFRHTTGYAFSGLLFGLGFFSIIKDPNKQGWHDKAVGSKVVTVKNLWPLSLVILLSLLTINFILISSSINRILTGPLKSEFLEITSSLNPPKSSPQLPLDFELENFTEPAY